MQNYDYYVFISDEDYAVAEKNGISKERVYQRVNLGWEVERAITQPVRKEVPFESEWKETAIANGIPLKVFRQRVRDHGWDEKEAATTPVMKVQEAWKRRKKRRTFTNEQIATMKVNNIPYNTALRRVNKYGWTKEDAITQPIVGSSERMARARHALTKKELVVNS